MCCYVLIDIGHMINSYLRYLAISFENRYLDVISNTCMLHTYICSGMFEHRLLRLYTSGTQMRDDDELLAGSVPVHNYLALKCCVMARNTWLLLCGACVSRTSLHEYYIRFMRSLSSFIDTNVNILPRSHAKALCFFVSLQI